MTTPPESDSQQSRTTLWLVLGGLVVVGAGIALGFVLGGAVTATTTTTTTLPPVTTTSTVPTTLPPQTTTTITAPVSTTTPSEPAREPDLVIPVAEDTYVESAIPDRINGAVEELVIETIGDDIRRALLRFNVDGLSADTPVQFAVLRLGVVDIGNDQLIATAVDGEWTEDEANWENAPDIGASIGAMSDVHEGEEGEIDVTSVVIRDGQIDFYLTTESNNDYVVLAKESGEGASLAIYFGG